MGAQADVPSRAELPQGCPTRGDEVLPSLKPWLSDGGQAPPSEESIAFLSSAVKPEHNFPGCHSNSSGKAYCL